MSCGFFSHMSSDDCKTVLVVNLGDVFLSLSLLTFSKQTITMNYETSHLFGARDVYFQFKQFLIEESDDERLTQPIDFNKIDKDLLTKFKTILSSDYLSSMDFCTVDLFEDETFEVTIDRSKLLDYLGSNVYKQFESFIQPMKQVVFEFEFEW